MINNKVLKCLTIIVMLLMCNLIVACGSLNQHLFSNANSNSNQINNNIADEIEFNRNYTDYLNNKSKPNAKLNSNKNINSVNMANNKHNVYNVKTELKKSDIKQSESTKVVVKQDVNKKTDSTIAVVTNVNKNISTDVVKDTIKDIKTKEVIVNVNKNISKDSIKNTTKDITKDNAKDIKINNTIDNKNTTIAQVSPTNIAIKSATPVVQAPIMPAKAITSSVTVVKPRSWVIDADDRVISVTLNKWANSESYTLIWEAPIDFQIQTNSVLTGSLKDVINEVLKSFNDNGSPLRAIWYKNHVIKITGFDNNDSNTMQQ